MSCRRTYTYELVCSCICAWFFSHIDLCSSFLDIFWVTMVFYFVWMYIYVCVCLSGYCIKCWIGTLLNLVKFYYSNMSEFVCVYDYDVLIYFILCIYIHICVWYANFTTSLQLLLFVLLYIDLDV